MSLILPEKPWRSFVAAVAAVLLVASSALLARPLRGSAPSGGGGASDPTTICAGAGYIGWWDSSDAATITQSAGLVSAWNDKGTGADHLLASGSARPTITGSGTSTAITFDETANFLATATDGVSIGTTDKMAVWFVGQRLTGIDASARILGYVGVGQTDDYNNATSATLWYESSPGTASGYRQGLKATIAASALDTTGRKLSQWDGANHELYVNNTASGTPVASTGNFGATGTLVVGAGGNFPPSGFYAKIAAKEIVMCAGLTITSGIRSSMDTYLQRWP